MAVPYTFGSATTSIPLSQLDSNFATTITLGNTAIQLGNTVTTLNNMTLGNVTVSSVASTFPNNFLGNSSVTIGSTAVALGSAVTSFSGLTALNFASGTNGIVFNNTSALVNSTLNDYETGSWTPTLVSLTGSYTSVTYGRQYGKYTKIGNLVYAMFDISTVSQVVGTAGADLLIAGFPFTMANSGISDSYTGSIGFTTGVVTPCSGLLQNSSGNNRVYIGITAGGTLSVSAQGTTGFGIRATICYQATF
jgi:hypothetical protein